MELTGVYIFALVHKVFLILHDCRKKYRNSNLVKHISLLLLRGQKAAYFAFNYIRCHNNMHVIVLCSEFNRSVICCHRVNKGSLTKVHNSTWNKTVTSHTGNYFLFCFRSIALQLLFGSCTSLLQFSTLYKYQNMFTGLQSVICMNHWIKCIL